MHVLRAARTTRERRNRRFSILGDITRAHKLGRKTRDGQTRGETADALRDGARANKFYERSAKCAPRGEGDERVYVANVKFDYVPMMSRAIISEGHNALHHGEDRELFIRRRERDALIAGRVSVEVTTTTTTTTSLARLCT